MTAAPAGTITVSCPTPDGGMLSVTASADPATGALAANAITCTGSAATGMVGVLDNRGATHYFTMTPGDVVTAAQLAVAGITNCSQVQSLSLALV
jgi:hypothetical protein